MTSWPPSVATLNDHGGDWKAYLSACYARYAADFLGTELPTWPDGGKRFAIKRQPLVDGQCHTFWHIVTEGADEESRLPNIQRSDCIAWPRAILDEFCRTYPSKSSARICWWIEQRGSESRYHIALADFSYLVIVADRGEYVLLWTAFPIERDFQRRKRRQKFESYWRGKG